MRQAAIIGLAAWVLLAPGPALAGPALVIDAKSGNVLSASEANVPWFPASLTKLMTAYVTFKAIRAGRIALDSKLTTSQRARDEPPSKLGLPVGAQITVDKALRALIVKSANDVAVVLAEGVSGSVEAFVNEMNVNAHLLGMKSTRFVNPNGLPDEEQVTTARDMALLARALIEDFAEHADLFGLDHIKVGKRKLRSYNRLLGHFEGADGMKTGFICASGYNIVASAKRGERHIVAVVMGAESGKARDDKAKALLAKGFDRAWWKSIAPRKLAEIEAPPMGETRPHHMGPVVCKRRYPANLDAYVVDARYRARAEAKTAAEAQGNEGEQDTVEEGPAAKVAAVPLPALRPAR